MKKQAGILLASMTAMALMTGCGQKEEPKPAAATEAQTTARQTEAETTEAETEETTKEEAAAETEEKKEETAGAGGCKTGLAIVSSMTSSKDAGDADGLAQVDSVAVAVVVDEEGKIVSCKLDTAQNKMGFTSEGKVVMKDDFQTKKELKEEYGMKAASGIGKEWYEQAQAMEAYVIGKTAQEVKGIAVDESSKATDADLVAGVTVKIGSYKEAIAEAAENAKAVGSNPGDKLGLGIITNMNKSKDAAEDAEGQCQAYSTYVAVTTDADGKVTSCIIDSTQGTVKFDGEGKITSDLTAGVKTKKQLGDDYGMKGASGIGKEWYEQAAAMEDYIIGKTAQEVAGIAVDEDEKPVDADLLAGVTVSIGGYQTAAVKAMENAE
ncbi:MAG: hypothetical protein HFG73_03175 [Hungatella sp.]|nr:hypothetical protein [Hungatella sp.]